MLSNVIGRGVVAAVWILGLGLGTTAHAESAVDKFHRAFYLEQGTGDLATACKLYAEVADDSSVDGQVKAQAKARLAVCKEEVASRDFMSLMPPDAIAYAEIKRPGDQILKLLEKLGLLRDETQPVSATSPRLAISPSLIREVLGVGGAAVAVTGFNPIQQMPSGVLIFHAGNLEVVRGMIETALPAGATAADPIQGFATFKIEDKVLVTLTNRLVVVSTERGPIEGVVRRLKGDESKSLADNPRIAEAVKDRGDSLVFFAVDAKMLMPYVNGVAAAAGGGRELAMAQAILDPASLQSIVGQLGINDEGAFFNFAIRLDKGHHNLVYNFIRTGTVHKDTLNSIPEGAAGFLVAGLNEPSSRFSSQPTAKMETPIVTGLDFGREFFANIISLGVFALPPESDTPPDGPPIPDVGAVITVNDPSKSEAFWRQILGLASLGAGAPLMEGESVRIEGSEVRTFSFPENVKVHFATVENDVLIGMTPSAIARSIKAKRSGQSILKDSAFTPCLSRLTADSTKAVFVHPGRCAAIAKRFMPPGDAKEMEPFLPLLSKTVVSAVVEHSGEMLRVSAQVSGIPDISGVVTQALIKEMGRNESHRHVQQAVKDKNWDAAVAAVDEQAAKDPDSLETVVSKFKILATRKRDRDAALACGETLLKHSSADAKSLNNLAWEMLTEDEYKSQYDELALRFSERSNKLSNHQSWVFLDTLALAKFKAGQADEAIKIQKKVLELSGGQAADELRGRLSRYEEALKPRGEVERTAVSQP